MQEEVKILPKFVNTDESFDKLLPDETPFAAGVEWGINGNPTLGIGLDSQVGEGANVESLTPNRSNLLFGTPILPAGYNINIGTYESYTTQELYYFNYNGGGNHGIYVLNGNTFTWSKIIEDPELEFTDNPAHFIAEHRVSLRIVYNKQKEIVEKILTLTDGNSWQKWILTMAAIATDGFNANVYPYWTLKQPHFDRKELLQWPTRPPMINPVATALPNTDADLGKPNKLIDQAWQFCCRFGNTDGRITVPSSYSDPVIIKSEDFLANPNFLPKNINVKFYAGSPLTEFIDVFMRKSSKKAPTVANTVTWSDWYWVERIYKYGVDPNVLSTQYWLRQNPWVDYNYDNTFNTLNYVFDNSRLLEIIDQSEFVRLQNDIPQVSAAQGVLDDKLALANNRVNYNNAPTDLIKKLEVTVQQKEIESCPVTLRKIKLYVYAGRDRGNKSAQDRARVHDKWFSQVAYTNGDDKTVRWGGLYVDESVVGIQVEESELFDLTFKDKEGFRFYLKGTPYFADCKWYVAKNDSAKTLVPIDGILDAENESNISFINSTFAQSSYFVGVAEFLVPAGRYVATIGRHNVGNSGNYRAESTYIMGIANSRTVTYRGDYFLLDNPVAIATLAPNAIVSTYKEMEIDCTAQDFDPWGNGADIFYVCTPFIGSGRDSDIDGGQKNRWSWVEGYLRESNGNSIPVELFPYQFDNNPIGYNGQLTDKNGFFWGYSWGGETRHRNISPVFSPNNFNCIQSPAFTFVVPNNSPDAAGWKPNNIGYVADYNGGQFGGANRILYFGKVTSLDGVIGYSNIGVSIVNGATVYTDNNGEFVLIIHNGQFQKRVSNVYVNAGGNFRINTEGCGLMPLFSYNENLVYCSLQPIATNPCNGATVDTGRTYPTCLNVAVLVEGGSQTTLKENASYSLGFAMCDLAGRLMPVNVFQDITIPSYLQTGEVVATYFRLLVKFALQIQLFNPDMKWFAPYVSPKTNLLKYLQWVGDKMEYIDSGGTVVTDASTAIFCRITIQSLYNYNLANNFSLLANWQFTPDDRVRILDNGEGQLFDVATYGEPIDLQILGTNYNDAAVNSGILKDGGTAPVSAPDLTSTPTGTQISFYVRYDSRLDKLIDKTGYWIELYTPRQQTEKIPYSELKWYPVIDGEISEFTGFTGNIPLYNKPTVIDITYWDTYLFNRNITIPQQGNKFFNHGFLSPNVSDAFGSNLTSGGRFHFRDDNARQIWKIGNVIKSDSYVINGLINGLGSFRDNPQNSTNYDNTDFGQILAMVSQRNVILFICENDFFTTNYDFHFAFPNEQGVMVVNQDSGLSRPFQKIGNNFGVVPDQTSSIIIIDKYVFWYDSKNEAFIMCDYKSARDVSDIEDEKGRKYGINSYLAEKTDFISNWNATHSRQERFDVITGVDVRTSRVYLTFRPRRNNSNNPRSYVTNRRNIDLKNQETVCFDIDLQRWVPGANYTPEAYGKLRGSKSGVEMITFAAGKPYYHLNTPNTNYLNYYGVQTIPVIMMSLNMTPEIVKIFMGIAQDILPNALRVDLVYDNELYSYSYLPANMIVKKENVFYGSFMRDFSSYNSPISTFVDGKRIFGRYVIMRLVGQEGKLNEYFQLSNVFYLLSDSPNNKK